MEDFATTGPKPFIFVLMPFSEQFRDIYTYGIKGAADSVGAYAQRVDDQMYDEGILERIFNQINKADVIVADMTGRNENVFYEVGYAHALNKLVVLLTQNANDIPFDLQHRPHIVYDGQITKLKALLSQRLQWAIEEARRRAQQEVVHQQFQVLLFNTELPEFSQGLLPPVVEFREALQNLPAGTSSYPHLRIYIRNTSPEISEIISYIYLFTEGNSVLVPAHLIEIELTSISPGIVGRPQLHRKLLQPLDRISASSIDQAKLGLSFQYQLDSRIPAIPPSAVETLLCYFQLQSNFQNPQPLFVKFSLRLHTKSGSQDFPFQLVFQPHQDEKPARA